MSSGLSFTGACVGNAVTGWRQVSDLGLNSEATPPPAPAPRLLRALGSLAPGALAIVLLAGWEIAVRVADVPQYMLPAPSAIGATLVAEWDALRPAWAVTLMTMAVALLAAIILGVPSAALLASSRLVERMVFPYAVMLQVTPLVAVAPFIVLLIGWQRVWWAQLACSWIVAFFPILSNTTIGFRSADRGLCDLFQLYHASPWQRLRLLLAPSALPYFLAGLKVSTNLALVGAVVAEFVVGAQVDNPGLASTIFESQLRSDAPTMFAALALISVTGVMAYAATHGFSFLLLRRWHDSALVSQP
ncbi:MAG: ABC transporter ATP-binding protein [Planctomycetota bacterium]|nr:MAG: ABC transporter ATP-binding protein [Planctomycetota bacterium]